MSLQSYQVCGHCDKLLCEKALKEHRRLYFNDGEWIRIEDYDGGSYASSPFCVSPPGSDDLGALSRDNELHEEMNGSDEFPEYTSDGDEERPSKFYTWSVDYSCNQ